MRACLRHLAGLWVVAWLTGAAALGLPAWAATPGPAPAAVSASAATGPDAGPTLHATRPRTARFCQTTQPFDDTGCDWREVSLPHRWQPEGPSPGWALYRFTWAQPATGAFGVLTEQLSLNGLARSGQETVRPSMQGHSALPHLRYWPQLFVFESRRERLGEVLSVDIAVQGHPQAKNGLASVRVAPLHLAQQLHLREVLIEVVLVLALAAASVMASLIGLSVGDHRTLADRLLRGASLLAGLAGLRAAMNFIVDPWLPWPAWQALGLWLLVAIGALATSLIVTYLRPDDRRLTGVTAAGLGLLAVMLALAPATWRFPLAELTFSMLLAGGCVLLMVLGRRCLSRPDPLGLMLLSSFLLGLLGGAHDLALHLGANSLSDRYVQKWATPALLVMMVVLLGRSATAQRAVERALQQETARRHDLLRDLHDGIGSRLVALAYHARQKPEHGSIAEEIDRLIDELQLIQGAVRARATTLELLVADLRHQFARVGGGKLPLVWAVSDLPTPCPLSAEQAVATARIVQEAVANAVKHARASRITLTLSPADGPLVAELMIADDGPGRFEEGAGAGLRHMGLRAQRAGLHLSLDQPGPQGTGKAVRLGFPHPLARPGWLQRLRIGLRVAIRGRAATR